MPRLIKSPNSGSTIVNAVTPAQGGHGEVTAPDALEAMDLVPRNSIGKFGRPIPLDGDGYIDQRYLQDLYATMETVSGDLTIEVNQTKEYFLTGYDAFSVYDVRAVSGMVSVDRNVITYTAPGEPGQGGFTINGRMVAVTVTEVNVVEGIAPPVMLTPVRGTAGLIGPVSVTSSAFVTDNAETHVSTSWQCAEDPGFTVIVASVDQSTVHKTSWSIGTVMLGKHYFIRAKYHGSGGGVSSWSEETHFTSPVPTPADRPVITSPVNGAARLPSRVTLTSSTYNTVTGDPHVSTSWEISESPLFTNLAFQNINSAVDKTSWMVSGLQPAKEYYARVRYRGQLHEYTEWSPTSAFRTRLAFLPETEIGKSGTYNGVSADMDDTGGRWIVGNGSFSTPGVNCAAYIYRRDGGVPVLEDTIQAVAGQKNMVTTIPAGGQLEVTVNGRYTSTKSYTQAEEIIVPAGAQTLTLVGKGSSSNEVTAFMVGNGSVQIPAGVTTLKVIGKGGSGSYVDGTTVVSGVIMSGSLAGVYAYYWDSVNNQWPDTVIYTEDRWGVGNGGEAIYGGAVFYNCAVVGTRSDVNSVTYRSVNYETDGFTWVPVISKTYEQVPVTGPSSTVTVQGQTYTYPGGLGGPATPRTDNIALNGTAQALTYNIPTGGSGQYGYPGSTGVSQSLTGTGEYIFPLGTPKVSITAKGGDGSMTTTGVYDDPSFKTESRKVNISISPLMYAGYESDDGYFLLYGGYSNGHSYSVTTPLPSSTVFHFRKDPTYLLSVEDLPDTITITGPNGTGGTITKTLRANFQGLHVFVSTAQGTDPLGFGLQYREAGGGSGFYVNLSFTTIDIRDTTEAKDTYLNKQSYGYSWIRQPSSLVAYGENNPYNAATLTYLKVSIGDRLFNFSQPGGGWGDLWCVKVSRKEIIFATLSTTIPYFPTDAMPDIYHQGNSVRWTTTDCWVESSLTPVAVQGQPSTFTIQGVTKTFPGGNGGPATVTTQEITLDGSDLSMNYSIPATGSGVVQYSVSTVYSNSFTGNGSHNVPADVTTVSITGRGQDGTPAITEITYPENSSGYTPAFVRLGDQFLGVEPDTITGNNQPETVLVRWKQTYNQDQMRAEYFDYVSTTVVGSRKIVQYAWQDNTLDFYFDEIVTVTPATTGENTVVTVNGQTYTYPGGVGGPATSRNDVVNVTAGSIKPLNYTVPQGGVVSLSYTTAVTPARETTATINGQTYTFSGSNTGAATNTTYTLSLVDNNAFANAVVMNQDGTLAAICSSPKIGSTAGYVLVLQRSGTSWNIVDELNRVDGLVWHAQSVSMDKTGNYILVGADAQPVGASKIGSFAIYHRQAGKYAVEQTVIAPDPGVAYEAGSSVSLSGNASIAVIGAPAGGVASRTLVYERDNDNTFVLTATLSKTTDPHSEDSFGTRVYISADGTTIAASSPTSRGVNTTHANCGEVIIFRKVDNVWTQVSTVRHPTPTSDLYFGQDLHLSDDGFTLSVGVPGGTGGLGEVMFFDIEGSAVTYKSNVVSSAVTGGTNFGKAIALPGHSGDLVGASKFGTYVFD